MDIAELERVVEEKLSQKEFYPNVIIPAQLLQEIRSLTDLD